MRRLAESLTRGVPIGYLVLRAAPAARKTETESLAESLPFAGTARRRQSATMPARAAETRTHIVGTLFATGPATSSIPYRYKNAATRKSGNALQRCRFSQAPVAVSSNQPVIKKCKRIAATAAPTQQAGPRAESFARGFQMQQNQTQSHDQEKPRQIVPFEQMKNPQWLHIAQNLHRNNRTERRPSTAPRIAGTVSAASRSSAGLLPIISRRNGPAISNKPAMPRRHASKFAAEGNRALFGSESTRAAQLLGFARYRRRKQHADVGISGTCRNLHRSARTAGEIRGVLAKSTGFELSHDHESVRCQKR